MRQRWPTIVAFLLVVVVGLGGITSCQKAAETRPTSTPEGASRSPGDAVPTAATRVSALTTTAPGAAATPQPGGETPSGGETPAAGETPAVVEPAATSTGSDSIPDATETKPPQSSSSGKTVTYTVKRGDTLSKIAAKYGTTWRAIANANNIKSPYHIYAGQKLKIPSRGSSSGSSGGSSSGCRYRHVVKTGDWVWQIARDYGVSPYDILAANGLTRSSAVIHAGQVLCIP
jgi:LysM repeat protein